MLEFFDPSSGVTTFAFDDVGSTNDEAFSLAKEKGLDFFFVTAKRQLKGRGRRGRTWVSDKGNSYTSIFLRKPAPVEFAATLSFLTAVSMAEALAEFLPANKRSSLKLKWPNDILFAGAKLAGILLEARMMNGEQVIVIGVGVNLAKSPNDTPYLATNLQAEGFDVRFDELQERFRSRFLKNLELWDQGRGFSLIRKKWLDMAHGLGDEILVRLEKDEVRGVFKDLDDEGRLIVALAGGKRKTITAGDVFYQRS